MGAAEDAGKAKWMDCFDSAEWRELQSQLRYLEAEGFIERWIDKDGVEWVRIAEGGEKVWARIKSLNYQNG